MRNNFGKYILTLTACVAVFVFAHVAGTEKATAQALPAQILMTWEADSYAPSHYSGKILPTSESRITVGLDLINLGRRVDLSPYKIFWYIDDRFYQGAPGLTRITFNAPRFIGDTTITVRASITDYGSGPGKTIVIPVTSPKIILQSSAPNLSGSDAPFTLRAYPYFFNIEDPSQLNYEWRLGGGIVGSGDSLLVTPEMANQRPAFLELSVNNPVRVIERLIKKLTLFNN